MHLRRVDGTGIYFSRWGPPLHLLGSVPSTLNLVLQSTHPFPDAWPPRRGATNHKPEGSTDLLGPVRLDPVRLDGTRRRYDWIPREVILPRLCFKTSLPLLTERGTRSCRTCHTDARHVLTH